MHTDIKAECKINKYIGVILLDAFYKYRDRDILLKLTSSNKRVLHKSNSHEVQYSDFVETVSERC